MALCEDQLDIAARAFAEQIVRRINQLELAVQRNPLHPDYRGLGSLNDGSITETDAVGVPMFMEWVTNSKKDRTNILRQDWLYANEIRHRNTGHYPKEDGNTCGKVRGRRKDRQGRGRGRGSYDDLVDT